MAQPRKRRTLTAGLLGSVALHGAAGAMVAAALSWRAMPAPPGMLPALQVVWLPPADLAPEFAAPAAAAPGAATDSTTLGPAAAQGLEPEDALATQVGALHLPATTPRPPSLLPLPIPEMEIAALLADPTALFAPLPPQVASPPVPPPASTPPPEAALPLPPPLPPRPRAASAAPVAGRPAAIAVPVAPPPAAPAAIPVVTGAPRFRRPPAPPVYPDSMRDAGIEGTALLRLRVAADGTTQEVHLLRSAGHRLLDAAAEAAARRWEIAPPLRDGQPMEAWVEVPVRFRLDE